MAKRITGPFNIADEVYDYAMAQGNLEAIATGGFDYIAKKMKHVTVVLCDSDGSGSPETLNAPCCVTLFFGENWHTGVTINFTQAKTAIRWMVSLYQVGVLNLAEEPAPKKGTVRAQLLEAEAKIAALKNDLKAALDREAILLNERTTLTVKLKEWEPVEKLIAAQSPPESPVNFHELALELACRWLTYRLTLIPQSRKTEKALVMLHRLIQTVLAQRAISGGPGMSEAMKDEIQGKMSAVEMLECIKAGRAIPSLLRSTV